MKKRSRLLIFTIFSAICFTLLAQENNQNNKPINNKDTSENSSWWETFKYNLSQVQEWVKDKWENLTNSDSTHTDTDKNNSTYKCLSKDAKHTKSNNLDKNLKKNNNLDNKNNSNK